MQIGIKEIKKQLLTLSPQELIAICLRLAKYKKDNKELLSFLLYDAEDPLYYAQKVKDSLEADFKALHNHYFYSTKTLRKILRTLSRHAKYTASKQVEAELLIWFCHNYLQYADTRTSHKPLRVLFIRQLEKIATILPKLHEDLQFDYQQDLIKLVEEAGQRIKGFNPREIKL